MRDGEPFRQLFTANFPSVHLGVDRLSGAPAPGSYALGVGAAGTAAAGTTGPGGGGAPVAAFFDLDKTLLAASSTLALGRTFRRHGMLGASTAARTAYAHAAYLLRGAGPVEMERMREFMTLLVAGWRVEAVAAVVREALPEVLLPLVYEEAAELVRWHQEFGRDVVVVSSSAEDVVRPLVAELGVTDVVASRLQVVDGAYTGAIDFYAYGAAKAERMTELARERGYDLAACYAYSDSVTDLPMLSLVGRPHAVNPDRALLAHAEANGWPVLRMAPPAGTLGTLADLPRPSPAALGTAAGTVGAVTATAGMGWYLAQRRRSRR